MFRAATGREPVAGELNILSQELSDRLQEFQRSPELAKRYQNGGGNFQPTGDFEQHDIAAYAAVSLLILNLDETLSKN